MKVEKWKEQWQESQTWIESSWPGKRLYHWICYRKASSFIAQPRAPSVLFWVHGFGEHSERYRPFLDFFFDFLEIDAIASFDHLGHGRSEGARGHTDSINRYVQDLELAIHQVEHFFLDPSSQIFSHSSSLNRPSSLRLHLCGHSLGGLMSFLFASKERKASHTLLASVTLSAPLFGLKVRVPWIQKKAAEILAHLWGSCPFQSTLDPSYLSHDLERVQDYQQDPHVHHRATPQFFLSLEQTLLDLKSLPELPVSSPIQFLVPLEDRIADPQKALQVYQAVHAPQKKIHTYPGFYHEIFNETGKERAFQDLKEWIQHHSDFTS